MCVCVWVRVCVPLVQRTRVRSSLLCGGRVCVFMIDRVAAGGLPLYGVAVHARMPLLLLLLSVTASAPVPPQHGLRSCVCARVCAC